MRRGLVFGFLVWCLAVLPGFAQQADPKAVAEILDLLAKHDEAFKEKNAEAVMNLYAAGPKTVLMGAGPEELWIGKQEIRDAYKNLLADFDPGSMQVECPWRIGDVQGDLAWLMAICRFTDTMKNEKREYGLNVSAVVQKLDGRWYFRTFHYSNAAGAEKP